MVSMATCKGCKTEFIPKRRKQEYHNRECFLTSTIRLLICPECGDEFKKKFKGQVCCSPKCAFIYRAKKNTKGRTLVLLMVNQFIKCNPKFMNIIFAIRLVPLLI